MKVGLEKSYPMPGSADVVWSFLQNIEGVARCMPGAKITERLDDTHFKGTVAVKVGPASMAFKGNIEVMGLDEAQRTLRLIGKGSDSSGTSGASLDLTARVEPGATADSSNLIGQSEVSMSGKAAAFGGRMMGTVADQILNQFAGNFAKQVSAIAAQAAAAAAAASAAAEPLTAVPTTAAPMAVGTPSTAAPGITGAAGVAAPGSVSEAPAANDLPDAPANEINALALFWAIIRDWFRGLFRRKPA
jgi:carbon monoxide dehydrogenase subunit G